MEAIKFENLKLFTRNILKYRKNEKQICWGPKSRDLFENMTDRHGTPKYQGIRWFYPSNTTVINQIMLQGYVGAKIKHWVNVSIVEETML